MVYSILTEREREIIERKIKGCRLTQNESNILSKTVRPKLREISKINAEMLLDKLEYNQKAKSLEVTIKKLILTLVKEVKAIIIYGSAIQTNYKNYNDIDVLVVTKEKMWKTQGEKYDKIIDMTKKAKEQGLILDVQLIDSEALSREYPHNPSLIYQLHDSKVIYGEIAVPQKTSLSKLDLRMKLDWSDLDDEDSSSKDLYQSLRNLILVRLLLKRIVDNDSLRESVGKELGDSLISNLKDNKASRAEKKLALQYIRRLSAQTDKEIKESQWEKIVL